MRDTAELLLFLLHMAGASGNTTHVLHRPGNRDVGPLGSSFPVPPPAATVAELQC